LKYKKQKSQADEQAAAAASSPNATSRCPLHMKKGPRQQRKGIACDSNTPRVSDSAKNAKQFVALIPFAIAAAARAADLPCRLRAVQNCNPSPGAWT
jgi:hypothetical protein